MAGILQMAFAEVAILEMSVGATDKKGPSGQVWDAASVTGFFTAELLRAFRFTMAVSGERRTAHHVHIHLTPDPCFRE